MTANDMDKAMIQLEKKSIAQALFVIGFVRDASIRTKQFEIENALAPLIAGPSVNTNLPDNFDPRAPRVTLSNGPISAHFSQTTAQLTIGVEDSERNDIDAVKNKIAHCVTLFQEYVDKVISKDSQKETGLVININYPIDHDKYKDEDIFDYIQSQFIKAPPMGAPASAGLNVGYKTSDNYFINLGVSQYKLVFGEIPVTGVLDISKLPVSESGIELKVDINNRPLLSFGHKTEGAASVILEKAFIFLDNDADNFMGIHQ